MVGSTAAASGMTTRPLLVTKRIASASLNNNVVASIIYNNRQQSVCNAGRLHTRSIISPKSYTTTTTPTPSLSLLHTKYNVRDSRRYFTSFSSRHNITYSCSSSSSSTSSSPYQHQSSLSKNSSRQLSSSGGKRDFYDVLNISKGADKGAIKKAYFKLAKQFHPDQNQDDATAAEKFKEASDAYEILKDDQKREMYDNYGHAGVDPDGGFGGGGNPFGGGGNPFGGAGMNFGDGSFHFSGGGGGRDIDPEDLFEAFFGGAQRQRGPRRGADLQINTRITFKEAVFGIARDLKLRYQIQDRATSKVETKQRVVTVDIPAGIENGMNLRLAGQGAEGDPGASRGNLLVNVSVEEDDYFQRDGADVHTDIPISLTQAVLGGTVDVVTLHGEVEVKIPKGCAINTKLLLRQKGIQRVNSRTKGNQIVHLNIEIPTSISARQEELMREFDEEAKRSGSGISGRLAAAAGSAFDSIFGSSKSDEKEKDDDDKDLDNEKAQKAV